jgi:hypothetical protein
LLALWMRIELELFVDGGVEFSEGNVAGFGSCNCWSSYFSNRPLATYSIDFLCFNSFKFTIYYDTL